MDRMDNLSNLLSGVPDSIISFVPSTIPSDSFTFVKCMDACEKKKVVLYVYDLTSGEVEKLAANFRDKVSETYNSNDSCLVIIDPYETPDPFDDETRPDPMYYGRDGFKNKIPLPNMIEFYDSNFYSKDSLYSIWVLDSKKFFYKTESSFVERPELPAEWKHGRTNGVAFGSDFFIFWGIVW